LRFGLSKAQVSTIVVTERSFSPSVSLLVLSFGSGALGLALTAAWFGLRLNDSPSMPIGLYVRTPSDSDPTW
jgi:hypothetical protein